MRLLPVEQLLDRSLKTKSDHAICVGANVKPNVKTF
jgi:hypothetical protein